MGRGRGRGRADWCRYRTSDAPDASTSSAAGEAVLLPPVLLLVLLDGCSAAEAAAISGGIRTEWGWRMVLSRCRKRERESARARQSE